jgi:hypothetical protein
MKLVKLAGLAALLALAGAAVVAIAGIGSAAAEEETGDPEIVLCKSSIALCPATEIWAGGKIVTATIEAPAKFLATPTFECKSSKLTGEVVEEMATSLTYKITAREIKTCNREGCNELGVKYGNMTSGKITVATGDKYSLKLVQPLITMECDKKIFCTYVSEAETATLPIDDPTTSGFPVVLANEVKMKLLEGGGSCSATMKWDASYILAGGALTVKFSLFKL